MEAEERQNPDVVLLHVGDADMENYSPRLKEAVGRLLAELDATRRRSAGPRPLAEIAGAVTEAARSLPGLGTPLTGGELENLRATLEAEADELRRLDSQPFVVQIDNPPLCAPVFVVCGTIMPSPPRWLPGDIFRRNVIDPPVPPS